MWSRMVKTAFLSVLLLAACTNTELFIQVDPDSLYIRVDLEADVCSPDPVVEEVPYKILFVIDTSLSNKWNDANERRVAAYLDAIETHIDRASIYFGIVTFNDYAHRPTLVFTHNREILLTAAGPLKNQFAGGGTNYEDAIHEMYQFIVDDLNATSNPTLSQRTHYLVYWLSDGFPTFGTTDRATLVANVEAVVQYLEPKVGEFRLNTLYLESTGEWETPDEIAGARDLLMQMAEAGGGTFTNINAGEDFLFDIDPQPQIRTFNFTTGVANNRNVFFGRLHPLVDSDSDGVLDDREYNLALDPASQDSDGDFYRDGVEADSEWLSADAYNKGCSTGNLDSDGDDLRDCEEEVAGTDPSNPDTDGDFLIDGLEFMLKGSPLSREPNDDADLDHVSDFSEVMAHLAPRLANSDEDKDRWGYRYTLVDQWIQPDSGKQCYSLRVSNVSTYQTLETLEHPQGWQVIELFAVFEAEDGSNLVQFRRAEGRAAIILPKIQMPATGIIRFQPEDFAPLMPTGGDQVPPTD